MTHTRRIQKLFLSMVGITALLFTLAPVPAAGQQLTARAPRRTKATCPFTGKSVARATVRRPAVAVRISNSPDGRSQIGIGAADLVIETLTEGGTTRLIAVFHCSSVSTTGPVRSARVDDATIVSPFSGLFAYSGANAVVSDALGRGDLTLVTEQTPGGAIYRSPVGSTDVNSLRTDLGALRLLARTAGLGKPASPFRFGDAKPARVAVTTITLDFGATSVGYRWDSKAWVRSQDGTDFRDADGRQVRTNNVLVQEVDADASRSLFDADGVPSPRFDLVGSGRALLFRNRRVVVGTWTDPGAGAPVFRTRKGAEMKLAPGRTWVEMVPSQNGELKGSISYR